MSEQRLVTIAKIIKKAAADFIQKESSGASLITITDVKLSNDEKYANILFTVLPEDMEESALDFTKRMRLEFREYIKQNTKLGRIPLFDFQIDFLVKNIDKK